MTFENAEQLRDTLLERFLESLRTTITNNIDQRFLCDEKREQVYSFRVKDHVSSLKWFFETYKEIFKAHQSLCDEHSKHLYESLILYRLAGEHHVRIPSIVWRRDDVLKRFKKVAEPHPSKWQFDGVFGHLMHYNFEWADKQYKIDCIRDGLSYYLVFDQYFLNQDGVRVCPEEGDTVIDAGACLGDTLLVFSKAVGEKGHVYALEPIKENLEICTYNIHQAELKNVTLLPYGLSDSSVEGPPLSLGKYAPSFSSEMVNDDIRVPLRTIDELVETQKIRSPHFIKMDIEGAELSALKGGHKTIKEHKPKLAISIYHQMDDIFEIINYLKKEYPFYKMYIEHHTIYRAETVLYCIAA